MTNHNIIKIRENSNLTQTATQWFHSKWGIPQNAYLDSMNECVGKGFRVPQWYVVMQGDNIIAGLGVIANDFHERSDLTPNVCAVYVEEEYRKQGIAGKILSFVCEDFHKNGIDTLYLVTSHVGFYERYGWKFHCMVKCDGEEDLSKMYVHIAKEK